MLRAAQDEIKQTIKWPPPLLAVRDDRFGLEYPEEEGEEPNETGQLYAMEGMKTPTLNNALRQRHLKFGTLVNDTVVANGTAPEMYDKYTQPSMTRFGCSQPAGLTANHAQMMGLVDFVGTAEEVQQAQRLMAKISRVTPNLPAEGAQLEWNKKTPNSDFRQA